MFESRRTSVAFTSRSLRTAYALPFDRGPFLSSLLKKPDRRLAGPFAPTLRCQISEITHIACVLAPRFGAKVLRDASGALFQQAVRGPCLGSFFLRGFFLGCLFLGGIGWMGPSVLLAQAEWEFHGEALAGGESGAWDGVIQSPRVVWDEAGERYRLFYRGWPRVRGPGSQSNVSWANSTDVAGPWGRSNVFALESTFLQGGINGLEVVRDPGTGTYRAYVTFASVGGSFLLEVRLATSEDLDRWEWWPSEPVFSGELPWEVTTFFGSTLSSVGQPSIVVQDDEYHMWYFASSGHGGPSLGYARSGDGIDWVRRKEPLFSGESSPIRPTILWHEDSRSFEMLFIRCCSSSTLSRGTSLDGVEWRFNCRPFLPFGEDGLATDGTVRFDPDLGEYHLWFQGERTGEEGAFWYATSPWTEPRASFSVTPELEADPDDWIPTAEFPAGELAFDATRSRTPEESGVTVYSWDFGDGTKASGALVTHAYGSAGEYRVVLTVTDAAGNTGSVAQLIRLTASFFRRGDLNGDGVYELSDGVGILNFLFLGSPPPECRKSADADDSGDLALTDGLYLLNHLFLGDAAPSAPFPGCGLDPTPDPLTCEGIAACR